MVPTIEDQDIDMENNANGVEENAQHNHLNHHTQQQTLTYEKNNNLTQLYLDGLEAWQVIYRQRFNI
jgi:hypothetical protein